MRVFIVDDSQVVLERLTDLLGEVQGIDIVGQAGNPNEAIRGIRKTRPDAVILDLQIPGGSGLDVLRDIRADHPNLFFLICTNYPYRQYRDECLSAGANYFLDKSTEFEKLPTIFRDLVKSAAKTALR